MNVSLSQKGFNKLSKDWHNVFQNTVKRHYFNMYSFVKKIHIVSNLFIINNLIHLTKHKLTNAF